MAVFLRKLLGIGKLPDDVRAQVDEEGVIFLAEFASVTLRFSGTVPGRKSLGRAVSYAGALALTDRRVLGTLATLPRKIGRAIDQPWTAPPGTMVQANFDNEGLLLDIADLSAIDPKFSGTLSLRYKTPLTQDILTRLPTRTLVFDVPPKFVYRAVGVPVRS
jgi:hypothetical protein